MVYIHCLHAPLLLSIPPENKLETSKFFVRLPRLGEKFAVFSSQHRFYGYRGFSETSKTSFVCFIFSYFALFSSHFLIPLAERYLLPNPSKHNHNYFEVYNNQRPQLTTSRSFILLPPAVCLCTRCIRKENNSLKQP
jgi:hypothetical protein